MCVLCGQRNVDGALNQSGDFVCIDCFADGNAHFMGMRATNIVPASTPYFVDYSSINEIKYLSALNGNKEY